MMMSYIVPLLIVIAAIAAAGAIASVMAGVGALREARKEGLLRDVRPELRHN